MTLRVTLAVALLLLGPGCFARYDPSRALSLEERRMGPVLVQDGRPVELWDTMRTLEAEEAAGPHARAWKRYTFAQMAAGAAAGGLITLGAFELADPDGKPFRGWTFLALGAAAIVPGQHYADRSETSARAAAAAHNASLPSAHPGEPAGAPPAERSAVPPPAEERACRVGGPWLVVLPDGRGGVTGGAGVAVAF